VLHDLHPEFSIWEFTLDNSGWSMIGISDEVKVIAGVQSSANRCRENVYRYVIEDKW